MDDGKQKMNFISGRESRPDLQYYYSGRCTSREVTCPEQGCAGQKEIQGSFRKQAVEEQTGNPVSVGQILREELHLTRRQISRVKFREDGILVNGEPSRVTRILQPGDLVCVKLFDERPASSRLVPSGCLPEILYEDPDVICVYKPAGIIIHPSGDHDQDSLANQVAGYLQQKGEAIQVRPVGRLDRGVTGVVVFARHRLSAARLWEQRRDGRFTKEYLACCKGVFPLQAQQEEQMLVTRIAHVPGDYLRMYVPDSDMRLLQPQDEAVTFYRVIQQEKDHALVCLHLKTGRPHQIRVHMAYLGHPVLGDPLYTEHTVSRCAVTDKAADISLYSQKETAEDTLRCIRTGNRVTSVRKPEKEETGIDGGQMQLCAWRARFLQPVTGEPVDVQIRRMPDWV